MATKTTFRDLHVDILLCIFDYLTVNEIYTIFFESIPHLTSLLNDSHIRLHLRHALIPELDTNYVVSMVFRRLPSTISFADFKNLRSLIIHDMDDPRVLFNQASFPSLEIFYLKLSLRNKADITLAILPMATESPHLRSYTLVYPSSYFTILEDAIAVSKSSITLKYLKLDVRCTIGSVEKLIQQLPSLQCLQATIESNRGNSSYSTANSLYSTIKDLHLTWDYIPFVDILELCQKMLNIKKCTLNVNDHRHEFILFDPNVWRHFIEIEHVELRELSVKMKCIHTIVPPDVPEIVINSIQDPYFGGIGFNFDRDHWGYITAEGHFVTPT